VPLPLPSFLNIAREPEPADAIFVFAGREERKRFGLELFRAGYAPRLILSVGRFEWRRFQDLGLWSDGGLVDMVQTIEAAQRHFFVHVERERVRCESVHKGQLGTMSEARALATVVARTPLASVLLVSSPEHLPRCVLSLRTVLTTECAIVPVASTSAGEPLGREMLKLAGYGVFSLQKFLLHDE
jgi:uncharacterized SAM-binding protein YcdF (DUF218 family)